MALTSNAVHGSPDHATGPKHSCRRKITHNDEDILRDDKDMEVFCALKAASRGSRGSTNRPDEYVRWLCTNVFKLGEGLRVATSSNMSVKNEHVASSSILHHTAQQHHA